MPERMFGQCASSEISIDSFLIKSQLDEFDEEIALKKHSSANLDPSEISYEFGAAPETQLPRSLKLEKLPHNKPDLTPNILIKFLNAIDAVVPPIERLANGLTEVSMRKCDSLLNTVIQNINIFENTCNSLHPGELTQMLQLLFLRFDTPGFVANPELCHYIKSRIFYMDPRMTTCKGKYTASVVAGNKLIKACLEQMSLFQQAAMSTFMKYCQRWCQLHVAMKLRHDPSKSSSIEFTEAISYLSGLFSNSFIGITREYISAHVETDDNCAIIQLKHDLFNFLLALSSTEMWHELTLSHFVSNETSTFVIPHLGGIEQTESSGVEHADHVKLPRKLKSFNWL